MHRSIRHAELASVGVHDYDFFFNPNAATTESSGRPCRFLGSALALRRSRRS